MIIDTSFYETKIAQTDQELRAAQRLRYRVFVEEMGATPTPQAKQTKCEEDAFDAHFDHLILIDRKNPDPENNVVGVYRLMTGQAAAEGLGFYSASEFDLSPLMRTGRPVIELGRSCLAPEHRGGVGLSLMWSALAAYVAEKDAQILFGVASFPGTDVARISKALALLHIRHLAPDDLRVTALGPTAVPLLQNPDELIEPRAAMQQMPSLIKAYLRLGGRVGQGAFVDHVFKTIDVCLILDTATMSEKIRAQFERPRG